MPSLFWSFILTKWYVNVTGNLTCRFNGRGFILTKWYVNGMI
ncbi:hypothetical protein [Clostridioides difficile]